MLTPISDGPNTKNALRNKSNVDFIEGGENLKKVINITKFNFSRYCSNVPCPLTVEEGELKRSVERGDLEVWWSSAPILQTALCTHQICRGEYWLFQRALTELLMIQSHWGSLDIKAERWSGSPVGEPWLCEVDLFNRWDGQKWTGPQCEHSGPRPFFAN